MFDIFEMKMRELVGFYVLNIMLTYIGYIFVLRLAMIGREICWPMVGGICLTTSLVLV